MTIEFDNKKEEIKPVPPIFSIKGLAGYTQGEEEEKDTAASQPLQVKKETVPPAGLPKSFWRSLGVGN